MFSRYRTAARNDSLRDPIRAMGRLAGIYERDMNASMSEDMRTKYASGVYYNHPQLNFRYGIELEFLASHNRFVIGNRINSCMFEQNSDWWRRSFDPFSVIDPDRELAVKPTDIQVGPDFNQYSSFFFEVTSNHASKSHKGVPTCENRGTSGMRIENDGSVTLDIDYTGITFWSQKANDELRGTDVNSEADPRTGQGRLKDGFRGLRDAYADHHFPGIDPTLIEYTLKGRNKWNDLDYNPENRNYDPTSTRSRYDPERSLKLTFFNELVSNVLTNAHTPYPNYAGSSGSATKLLPLGTLLLDNALNHMKAHNTVIGVQDMGFHVHLSEFPMIESKPLRKEYIIGFFKLFYIFEPLLYAYNPGYRSRSVFCQSMQSIFTLQDLMTLNTEQIWDALMSGRVNGVNRVERNTPDQTNGARYVSFNITNCRDIEGAINTIEIRLGHSTFSSYYIQAFVNLLQNLYRLSIALTRAARNATPPQDPSLFQNSLLRIAQDGYLPDYCLQPSTFYDRASERPSPDFSGDGFTPNGRPIYGFFTHNRRADRQTILNGLESLLYMLIQQRDIIGYLHGYMNYYHALGRGWCCENNIDAGSVDQVFHGVDTFQRGGVIPTWNRFRFVTMGVDYLLNTGVTNLDHDCQHCSRGGDGGCTGLYNQGNSLSLGGDRSFTQAEYIDESQLYRVRCDGETYGIRSKVQTELIAQKRLAARAPSRSSTASTGSRRPPNIPSSASTAVSGRSNANGSRSTPAPQYYDPSGLGRYITQPNATGGIAPSPRTAPNATRRANTRGFSGPDWFGPGSLPFSSAAPPVASPPPIPVDPRGTYIGPLQYQGASIDVYQQPGESRDAAVKRAKTTIELCFADEQYCIRKGLFEKYNIHLITRGGKRKTKRAKKMIGGANANKAGNMTDTMFSKYANPTKADFPEDQLLDPNAPRIMNSRINKGADRILLLQKDGKYEANLVDWVGDYSPMTILSDIVNDLVTQNIVTPQQLEVLEEQRYIDYYVFNTTDDAHIQQLSKELDPFGFDEATVKAIQAVYLKYSAVKTNQNVVKKVNTTRKTVSKMIKRNKTRQLSKNLQKGMNLQKGAQQNNINQQTIVAV